MSSVLSVRIKGEEMSDKKQKAKPKASGYLPDLRRQTIALETIAASLKLMAVVHVMEGAKNDIEFDEIAQPERDAALKVLIPGWFEEIEK